MQFTSRKEAAEAAGIGERTLRGYLHDKEFISELNRLYDDWMDECTQELQQAVKQAIKALRGALTEDEAPLQSKIAAARIILDSAPKYLELNNILQRIDNLEREVEK